jgi:hypothetical protein
MTMSGHIVRSSMRTTKVKNDGSHWYIIAMTKPLEIINIHRPFEISIVMSEAVSFVPREWADRKHITAVCYPLTEPSPNDDEARFLEPIPEFARFNPITQNRAEN